MTARTLAAPFAPGLLAALDEHAIVSVTDASGRILHVNRRFCEISGYTREELIGQTHRLLKSGLHDAAFYVSMWADISAGKTWRGEVCNRRKSGELYWVEASITPELDSAGLPCRYVSIRTDISATKLAQQRAEQAQAELALFRQAVESSGEGIALCCAAGGRLSYLNPAARAMLGLPLDAAIGARLGDLLPRQYCANFNAAIEQVRLGRAAHIEFLYRRPDGLELPLRDTLTPVSSDDGSVSHWVHVIGDRSAEIERQQALHVAIEEARRANRAKAEFISGMSHELRTPLNAILGFSQVLMLQPGLDAMHSDSVREILQGGKHLLGLVDELLDISRIDLGTLRIALKPVRLCELVEHAVSLAAPREGGPAVSLSHSIGADTTVLADELRLRQCLINLINNAIKYNRDGGQVHIDCRMQSSHRVRIEVRDNGQGMAEADIAQLFEPFKRFGGQVDRTAGIGIGLTITQRLIRLMNGSIGVTSEPNVGSVFWIELAATEPSRDPALEPGHALGLDLPDPTPPLLRRQVLYVEDKPEHLRLVRSMLQLLPEIQVHTALDADQGMNLARAEPPDLILIDVDLPGVVSQELLARLRREPGLAGTPIIAISAQCPRPEPTPDAQGFYDVLSTPVDVQQLLQRVRSALALPEGTA